MASDGKSPERERPANDNGGADGTGAGQEIDPDAVKRLDRVVLTIARAIGRQLAREHFEALQAANDNRPSVHHHAGSEAEDDD